jgi:LPS sulfotransferase NodH
VAQAVSWAHPGEAVAPEGQDPHYDEELIGRLVATIERSEADWTVWFAAHSIVPCEVTYEELAADPPRTAQEVLDYLGLDVSAGSATGGRAPSTGRSTQRRLDSEI